MTALQDEWLLLQKQHEHYEFATLAIKLVAIVLFAFGLHFMPLILAVTWLQDGIVKTFQSRLGERILRVEQMIREGKGEAMQLHSEWLASRPRGAALLREYALSACRPTVAFPYLVLLAVVLFKA